MKIVRHFLWAVAGAASFWSPVILIFAVERSHTSIAIANLMALLGFLLCWAIRRWVYPHGRQTIWILLGLYCFGPILLSTATTFANGGFTQMHGWPDAKWLLLACIFPPLQFLLAAMSGLWPSLSLVTVILVAGSAMEGTGSPLGHRD
jgi:hypothetical protein